jgi:hypothetical protein
LIAKQHGLDPDSALLERKTGKPIKPLIQHNFNSHVIDPEFFEAAECDNQIEYLKNIIITWSVDPQSNNTLFMIEGLYASRFKKINLD